MMKFRGPDLQWSWNSMSGIEMDGDFDGWYCNAIHTIFFCKWTSFPQKTSVVENRKLVRDHLFIYAFSSSLHLFIHPVPNHIAQWIVTHRDHDDLNIIRDPIIKDDLLSTIKLISSPLLTYNLFTGDREFPQRTDEPFSINPIGRVIHSSTEYTEYTQCAEYKVKVSTIPSGEALSTNSVLICRFSDWKISRS